MRGVIDVLHAPGEFQNLVQFSVTVQGRSWPGGSGVRPPPPIATTRSSDL